MPNVSLRDSIPKAFLSATISSLRVVTVQESYNISSISSIAIGFFSVSYDQPFNTSSYACFANATGVDAPRAGAVKINTQTNTSCSFTTERGGENPSGSALANYDPTLITFAVAAPSDETTPPTYSLRGQSIYTRINRQDNYSATDLNISSISVSTTSSGLSAGINYTFNYDSSIGSSRCIGATVSTSDTTTTDAAFVNIVTNTTTSSTVRVKRVGENISDNQVAAFNVEIIDFITFGSTTQPVRLRKNTLKAWASITGTSSSVTAADSSGVSSVASTAYGSTQVNFNSDILLADCSAFYSSTDTGTFTGTVNNVIISNTTASKSRNYVAISTDAVGENTNPRKGLRPTILNCMVFGDFNELTVTNNRSNLYDFCTSFDGCAPITDLSVTANTTDGSAPYSYVWLRVGGSKSIVPTNPTGATTQFYSTETLQNKTIVAFFECVVTDSLGRISRSPSVTVTLEGFTTN